MKNSFVLAAALLLVTAASCNKNYPEHREIVNDVMYDVSSTIASSVAFIGSAGDDALGQALMSRVTRTGTVADADVLVVRSSELEANRDAVGKAWEDGRVIVEMKPSVATHTAFWESLGAPAYLSGAEALNDLILLAVHNHSCYQLQNPFHMNVLQAGVPELEEENCSESSSEDRKDLDNVSSVPVPVSETVEFLNTKLNSLVEWVGQHTDRDFAATDVPSFDGDLSRRISDAGYAQHIRKTFQVGADNFQICKVALSDPDVVTRHSTIDLDLTVVPLYGYEQNGNNTNGDYYFVTMTLISHNAPLYGLYKKWHGWVRTWAHIFYGKKLAWDATLMSFDGTGYQPAGKAVEFFETPTPATTESGMSYTSGFSAALNITGQGGISAGKPTATITVGGSFTWSNSQTQTVSDQSIEMSTDPATRAVSYAFMCNNDAQEDATEDAVRAIARSDQKCEATWCWHVPSTMDDDTSTRFALLLNLTPTYGYMYRHATWTVEGRSKTANLISKDSGRMLIELQMPDRRRNGVIEVKCTSSEYMHGLSIIDKDGNTVARDDGSYERNLIQRYQVPVGTYSIEYEIRDGDTGELKGRYRISDVQVNTAETVQKASFEGERI